VTCNIIHINIAFWYLVSNYNTILYSVVIKSELNIGEESKLDPTDPSLSAHVVNHTEGKYYVLKVSTVY